MLGGAPSIEDAHPSIRELCANNLNLGIEFESC